MHCKAKGSDERDVQTNEWYPIVYSYKHNDLSSNTAGLGYKQTSWGHEKRRT
jgi:hypothetical protein